MPEFILHFLFMCANVEMYTLKLQDVHFLVSKVRGIGKLLATIYVYPVEALILTSWLLFRKHTFIESSSFFRWNLTAQTNTKISINQNAGFSEQRS